MAPHDVQEVSSETDVRSVPHSLQKAASSRTSAEQWGHCMGPVYPNVARIGTPAPFAESRKARTLNAVQNPFHGVTPRHLGLLVVKTIKEFMQDQCTQMAAAISYYVLFSLFPLSLLAVGISGLVLQNNKLQADLIQFLQDNLPLSSQGESSVADNVASVAKNVSAFGLFGLVGVAWAGSGMFSIIRRSLNRAFDLDGGRPFVRQKLVDFAMMAVLGTLFLASITATGTLRAARAYTNDIAVLGDLAQELGLAWDIATVLVPVTVSWFAFFLLYWLVPSTHVHKREAAIGAFIASLLFEGAKVGFAVYVENFGNYNVVYGSLGGVVAFLFWVFLSANIMLLGAEVASEYPRIMAGEYDGHRTRVPTADSLTPMPIRIRRTITHLLKGLVVMRPGKGRS